MRNKYQSKRPQVQSQVFVVRGQELLVQVPLPIAEAWKRTGSAGGRS